MVDFTEKWGRDTARERYGAPTGSIPAPKRSESLPQCPEDKHGPDYDNDHKMDWIRGANENATSKPGFDKSASGKRK